VPFWQEGPDVDPDLDPDSDPEEPKSRMEASSAGIRSLRCFLLSACLSLDYSRSADASLTIHLRRTATAAQVSTRVATRRLLKANPEQEAASASRRSPKGDLFKSRRAARE